MGHCSEVQLTTLGDGRIIRFFFCGVPFPDTQLQLPMITHPAITLMTEEIAPKCGSRKIGHIPRELFVLILKLVGKSTHAFSIIWLEITVHGISFVGSCPPEKV